MMRRHSTVRLRVRSRAIGIVLCLSLGACLDGPFARVNPHDAGTDIALSIVGGVDTARVVGETLLFQLATEPVTTGVTVVWRSDAPSRLLPTGYGQFVVMSLPLAPATVRISAIIGGNSATRDIVLMPTSP